MKTDLTKLSTQQSIRATLLEASLENTSSSTAPDLSSRLTLPLNTANRNVSSAIATIGLLPPETRKAASLTLLDISEAALKAVEKALKRSGTEDPTLLQKLRRIIKLQNDFEEDFFNLVIIESEDIEGIDPEDSDGATPTEFDSGLPNQEISALAIRVLKDNSDMDDPDLAAGDPAEDTSAPAEGEANDVTVDTAAATDTVINTIADAPNEQENSGKLPPVFTSKGTNESIHTDPSQNLTLLNILMKTM